MKVICNGYNTCENAYDCRHSEPHGRLLSQNNPESCYCVNDKNSFGYTDKCNCNENSLRKYKLEKINESTL